MVSERYSDIHKCVTTEKKKILRWEYLCFTNGKVRQRVKD